MHFIKILLFIAIISINYSSYAFKSEEFWLKNGMQCVVIPNNKVPAISHIIFYKTGAIDEKAGKSGLAHFLEHLMFKSTKNHKTGEFSSLITQTGGENNAFTTNDYTGYYENIPKSELENIIKLEADRMQNLNFNEDEFNKEREVIIEEKRMRLDNNPEAILEKKMEVLLYKGHPYEKPTIGKLKDLRALSINDTKKWYDTYYKPNNAILIVSGDISAKELKPLAEKYYGSIKSGNIPTRINFKIPSLKDAQTVSYSSPLVGNDKLIRRYLAPSQNKKLSCSDCYALIVLSELLGSSQTSLLYDSLVRKQKLAVNIETSYYDLFLGPSSFAIEAVLADGINFKTFESALNAELNKFINNPIDEQDLARVKNTLTANLIYDHENLQSLAYIYGQAMIIGVGRKYVETWEDKIKNVTKEQVQNVAKNILQDKNNVTGYLIKADVK